MSQVSITIAKARLSELVRRAEAGEVIRITRRGKPVAQITVIRQPRKPVDVEALRELTESMPMSTESAGDFIRRMRDDARY